MTKEVPPSQRHLEAARHLKQQSVSEFDSSPPNWVVSTDGRRELFPEEAVALLAQLQGEPLDDNARKRITAQQLFYTLDYYVAAEQGAVRDACERLSDPKFLPRLPQHLRAGAREVSRQEKAHSEAFVRLGEWIRRQTMIDPLDQQPVFLLGLDELVKRSAQPPTAMVVFAALTEVYPPTLAPLLAGKPHIEEAVRTVFLEHEDEELLHRAYWWHVLDQLWRVLDSGLRLELKQQMPRMLGCHMRSDTVASLKILRECLPSLADPEARVRTMTSADSSARYTGGEVAAGLRDIGILEDSETASFVDSVVNSVKDCLLP